MSFVIDELQKVAEIDSALPALFKSLTDQELRGVALVLSGSWKVEVSSEGWRVSDPLFAQWLAQRAASA